ncbi:glycosyltransferase family 2 protein [Rhodococcus sp. MEB064]|uniref:glycosyltransferase family 2 protein n=1 Tax=Rhodococcus sp. MEB064 TaxID=1587522 RepID=UPI000A7C963B|nr:glycosyltransferase family 2 protein [Rhodococcus sp. MEB064]
MTEVADRVTVVMITHNRRAELERTLKHMTSLSDEAPIVLVDNASTDGTVEMVRDLFPEVRLLALSENLGGVARNRAVDIVTTPYVAFCDDDTRWQEGALSLGAARLDA